jgi:ribonuclease HI
MFDHRKDIGLDRLHHVEREQRRVPQVENHRYCNACLKLERNKKHNGVASHDAAELQGISLALQIAQGYASGDGERKGIAIYTDNQAAIWSIAKAEGRSGAYILADIAQQVLELQNKGYPVTVRWIPAHMGIPGNEAADQAAKETTGWREDGCSQQPADPPAQLHPLKTTLRRWCKM